MLSTKDEKGHALTEHVCGIDGRWLTGCASSCGCALIPPSGPIEPGVESFEEDAAESRQDLAGRPD